MSKLSGFFKRLFKKQPSINEEDDSTTLVIPTSLELVAKMSEKFDDDAASDDEAFDIEKFLADDMFESLRNERDRYRECLLQIDDVSDIEDTRFEIRGDEEAIQYVFIRSSTTLLNVDKPGEYRCIYEYQIKPGKPAIKGEMLCITNVEQYKHFTKIEDLKERANNIFILLAAGVELAYEVGTMIEIPRACLTADEIAKEADFFCFGTNDLTQMTYGFSRDDAGKFLEAYYDKKIFENDPFAKLDQNGVGKLMEMSIKLGKGTNDKIHCGICGEHGGDPVSVEFCHNIGLDYVSCSPFRVPVARLAAAQAAIKGSK